MGVVTRSANIAAGEILVETQVSQTSSVQSLQELATWLVDKATGQPIEVINQPETDGSTLPAFRMGDTIVPVRAGIPRFVPDDAYVESFGYQWNKFNVRIPQEDEDTFAIKTGVHPSKLANLRVLDAGCGGGRYALTAGLAGAKVLGVDRSSAVLKARSLCADLSNVHIIQADLMDLPIADAQFDLVFSIGVLHHGPDPRQAFNEIARTVKTGGRLSVWLYRKCTWVQEKINDWLRSRTTNMPHERLVRMSKWGAFLGGVPIVNRTLNKIVSFSAHPDYEIRVCDTFDWYSPKYQSHHTLDELCSWFRAAGFEQIAELPPAKTGSGYRWAHDHGLLIGSGVNVTGVRKG